MRPTYKELKHVSTAERPASQPSKQHSAEAPRAEGTCASCSRYAALTSVYGTCTALYVAGAAAGFGIVMFFIACWVLLELLDALPLTARATRISTA